MTDNKTPNNVPKDSPEDLGLDDIAIKQLSVHEQVTGLIQKKLTRIGRTSAITLASILFTDTSSDVSVQSFKNKPSEFIRRNSACVEKREQHGITKYYLTPEIIIEIRRGLVKLLDKIGYSSIKTASEDDEDGVWEKVKLNGEEVFEATKHSTFYDVVKKTSEEGKNVNYRYNFNKPDMDINTIKNVESLQLIELHVTSHGELIDYPLEYVYSCPEPDCGHEFSMKAHEVESTAGKMKCPYKIVKPDAEGRMKSKRCNNVLFPSPNRTTVKSAYIYHIHMKSSEGKDINANAISFRNLPRGRCVAAVHKIPNPKGLQSLFILDYQRVKKDPFIMPKKKDDEHYLMTLIPAIEQHIVDKTGYMHYGFFPVKIAYIIKALTSYNSNFRKLAHVMLSGDRSTGKSLFLKYWGPMFYGFDFYETSAASVSVPKLRGTMETIYIFNKQFTYPYTGLFGIQKEILIDEINDDPDIKKTLKQYLLEDNYDYTKQGGNDMHHVRTTQVSVTQNVDVKFKRIFEKDCVKIYNDLEAKKDYPKKPWPYGIDTDLSLNEYDDPYVFEAVKRTRQNYEKNNIFWQDGSSLPEAQRFFFNFFLSRKKDSEKLSKVLKENATRNVIGDSYELKSRLCNESLKDFFSNQLDDYFKGNNDIEYFNKVDELLDKYDIGHDPRFRQIGYSVLKAIKMIDMRKDYNETDIEIFTYLIENMYTKIEIADTDDFKIKGPSPKGLYDNLQDDPTSEDGNTSFDYNDTLDILEE